MNWLNQFNLIPKNFIVANIVDILKNDPENGVEKIHQLANTYITDNAMKQLIHQIKSYYDTHPAHKLLLKNVCYNTSQSVLNHTIQNIAVNALLDGQGKRDEMAQKHQVNVPFMLKLDLNMPYSKTALDTFITSAKSCGIHLFLLEGQIQPLLSILQNHSDAQFFVSLSPKHLLQLTPDSLEKLPNIIPLVAIDEHVTPHLNQALLHLKKANLLYGVTSRLDIETIKTLLSTEFTLSMIRGGARVHFIVKAAQNHQLTQDHLDYLNHYISETINTKPFIPLLINQTEDGLYSVTFLDKTYSLLSVSVNELERGALSFLKQTNY